MRVRILVVTAVLLSGVVPAGARSISNYEAGRLTFEALTATPRPVFRPAYRRYARTIMATGRLHHHHHVRRWNRG